jgi:hypothetical protein
VARASAVCSDLPFSPTFERDRFVYAFYSDANYTEQHVIRWHDCRGTGLDPTVLITLPAGSDCCHKGGSSHLALMACST